MEKLEKIYKIWLSNCNDNIYKVRFTKYATIAAIAWILFLVLSLTALFSIYMDRLYMYHLLVCW